MRYSPKHELKKGDKVIFRKRPPYTGRNMNVIIGTKGKVVGIIKPSEGERLFSVQLNCPFVFEDGSIKGMFVFFRSDLVHVE